MLVYSSSVCVECVLVVFLRLLFLLDLSKKRTDFTSQLRTPPVDAAVAAPDIVDSLTFL